MVLVGPGEIVFNACQGIAFGVSRQNVDPISTSTKMLFAC